MKKKLKQWEKNFLMSKANHYFRFIDKITIKDKTKIGLMFMILFGITTLILSYLIFLIVMFVEQPIRMLIYKGKINNKIRFWFKCWSYYFRGC